MNAATDLSLRVLALSPTRKDAELTRLTLARAQLQCECFTDLEALTAALGAGCGAVILPEEAIAQERKEPLARWLRRQPPWSDLPVLVVARAGADSSAVAQAMDLLGNITVIERPVRVAALISALRSALRARRRQYELRAQFAERERYLQALRDADRRKDEFLATLAHELRNPLAPISNSVELLQFSAAADPQLARLRPIMERQVRQMVRLVDDLLEMSRVTRGRIELQPQRIEIAAVIRNAVETSRPLIDAAHHRLAVQVPAVPLMVKADAVRLAQVFANLLNNAAKYTDDGGTITIAAQREGDSVAITVRDSGSGIPSDMLPRVFDLFTRLPDASQRAHGGLGIGLTLVKNLVEMHGGTVRADSAGPGHGSEFVVRLPLLPGHAGERPAPEPVHAPLAPRRVLLVDDNRDAATSLGMLLQLLGMTTRVVNSGTAALEALADFEPDVVFLDLGMPEMDGHEVARRIRAEPRWQHLTLIAMTGWGQEEDRRRSREAGFDHHLIKPAEVHAIENLLRSLEAPVDDPSRLRGAPAGAAGAGAATPST